MSLLFAVLLALTPGVERWSVKVLAPSSVSSSTYDVPSFLQLPPLPLSHNDARAAQSRWPGSIEGQEVELIGWLRLVALETDGDLHCQLAATPDGVSVVIVEVPDPSFVALKLKPVVTEVRLALHSLRRNLPVRVRVRGVLFFDDAHVGTPPRGKKGMKSITLWELHPVTFIEEVL